MYYIYKITNLLNSKIYIGFHFSLDISNDKYMGSGFIIRKAIKKYGVHNFKREILFEYDDIEEALSKEKELVNTNFVKRLDTYNLTIGGKGGFIHYSLHGHSHNKNKIGICNYKLNKNKYVYGNELQTYFNLGWQIGNTTKNRSSLYDTIKKKIIYVPKEKIKEILQDSRYIKYNMTLNKKVVHDPTTNKLKYIDPFELNDYLNKGYEIGNTKCGIHKNSITVHHKITKKNKRIQPENLTEFLEDNTDFIIGRYQRTVKNIQIYNPETDIELHIDTLTEDIDKYLNNGFIKGIRSRKFKGTIWIYKFDPISNKYTNKRINSNDATNYLNAGWSKGMIR
jgi:hypothetical protein